MKERVRLKPTERRDAIVRAAIREAEIVGFQQVTRRGVATRADCSETLVNHYAGTLKQLRRLIIGEALRTKNLKIIAQGLAAKDPRCRKLDDATKQQALANL